MRTLNIKMLITRSHQAKTAWLALAAVLFMALLVPVTAWDWEGLCTGVSEGDTIKVLHDGQEVKIRLASIDCPERGQPFSQRILGSSS
jgi:endonuclease YncB( thermonuclease family)